MNRNKEWWLQTMKKSITRITLLLTFCSFACVAMAAPVPTNADYSGVQLRQMQEQMERERIEQQMREHREKQKESIEDQQQKPSGQKGAVRFALHSVETDESQILTPEKRNEIAAPYIGKEVSLDDLYEMVEKINKYYLEHPLGKIICRQDYAFWQILSTTKHIDIDVLRERVEETFAVAETRRAEQQLAVGDFHGIMERTLKTARPCVAAGDIQQRHARHLRLQFFFPFVVLLKTRHIPARMDAITRGNEIFVNGQ